MVEAKENYPDQDNALERQEKAVAIALERSSLARRLRGNQEVTGEVSHELLDLVKEALDITSGKIYTFKQTELLEEIKKRHNDQVPFQIFVDRLAERRGIRMY